MIKHIFKVEEIQPKETKVFLFPVNSQVIVNHFQLKRNMISRIEVFKSKDIPNKIFIILYNKDKEIGTIVTREPYVLDLKVIYGIEYYDIRPLEEGDIK